ncbi:MAG: HEAT repeat domain-containing protein [Verrucomicrobiales bacterium]|nr:HEAT repeat domain-containing protein [Verrucomicrobiales bacterium]
MKPHLHQLTLGVLAWVVASPVVAAGTSDALRYRFTPAQTNAYRVTLETTFQDQPTTLAGVVFVITRSVEEGVATMGFQGTVIPQPTRGSPFGSPFPPGPTGGWFPRPIHFQPQVAVRVDTQGRVVQEFSFDTDLPAPFGSLPALFFEPLPPSAPGEWSTRAESWIPDETPPLAAGRGPERFVPYYGGYPGRPAARLAVHRTVHGCVTDSTDTTTTWTTSVELTSLLLTDASPRLQASAEGTVVFDRARGQVREVRLQALSTVTTPTLTQRRPMTLAVRLLEGGELGEALEALKPRPDEPPPPITADELTPLLRDAEVPDETRRVTALNRLQSAKVESPTPELLALAVRLAQSADYTARATGASLLGRYGTAAELPAMLRLLQWSQPGEHQGVLERVGSLEDPRAIVPLVDLVARASGNSHAVLGVLKRFGAAAEPAVLALLEQRHAETRRQACELLGEIGTAQSVEPLRRQMLEPDQQVSQAATTALRAVSQRLTEPTVEPRGEP